MIKAIETSYKGYRFRSRLEARWAVFFDAIGIEWEYEKEGYDLGEAGWYLPDFWLPNEKIWVEIKPEIDNKTGWTLEKHNVYMAGKIRKNCWRHDIVDLRGATDINETLSFWPNIPIANEFNLHYCGPYFIECDHGCSHRVSEHGCGIGCTDNSIPHRDYTVTELCFKAIEASDSIFVWIDTLDCYATLIEIGYAISNKKQVFVAIHSNLKSIISNQENGRHDLWFLEAQSLQFDFFNSAKEAFDKFYLFRKLPEEAQKIKGLAASQGNHWTVCYGDPLRLSYLGSNYIFNHQKFYEAAEAARSARFEHK